MSASGTSTESPARDGARASSRVTVWIANRRRTAAPRLVAQGDRVLARRGRRAAARAVRPAPDCRYPQLTRRRALAVRTVAQDLLGVQAVGHSMGDAIYPTLDDAPSTSR